MNNKRLQNKNQQLPITKQLRITTQDRSTYKTMGTNKRGQHVPLRSSRVDAIFTTGGEVVRFVDLLRVLAFSNANHPKKFVDVVARVANQPPKDHKHIVNAKLLHDFVGCTKQQQPKAKSSRRCLQSTAPGSHPTLILRQLSSWPPR